MNRAVPGDEVGKAAKSSRGELRMAVIHPGYPGSTEVATGLMNRLTRYLTQKTSLRGLAAVYYNVPKDAVSAEEEAPFAFGLVSLGFYLKYREALELTPLLEVVPPERYYLLALKTTGGAQSRDLAGKAVVGGALYEMEFLRRVVFADRAGVGDWKAVPTLRITRGLRKMGRGHYEAVVLTGREYRTLETRGKLKKLEKIAQSDYYPTALFVVFGKTDGASEAGRSATGSASDVARDGSDPDSERVAAAKCVAGVLEKMESDPPGKEILETMGCEGFRAVRTQWLEKLEKRYVGKKK